MRGSAGGGTPWDHPLRYLRSDVVLEGTDNAELLHQPLRLITTLYSIDNYGALERPMGKVVVVASHDLGLGCAKTSGRQVFAFFCSAPDHRPQNSGVQSYRSTFSHSLGLYSTDNPKTGDLWSHGHQVGVKAGRTPQPYRSV